MTDKSTKRARAFQASTGVSLQAARNELGKQFSNDQRTTEFEFEQVDEAIKLLPPRLPEQGSRVQTDVYSLSVVDAKGTDGAIPIAPSDRIFWDVKRESFQATLNLCLDPLPQGLVDETEQNLVIGLSIRFGGQVRVQEYDTARHVGRFTINIPRTRHRGDPSKVNVIHSFVWDVQPFLNFSEQCPDCKRWIHCRDEADGVCFCGSEFTIRFDREADWTMKQGSACMDCGCKDGFTEPKEGRNPWRYHSTHQTQCNRCHEAARTTRTEASI